ncbi:hypothetical protein QCE49_13935 [Caballeronia sp. LZ008]|uniref:hypothetical protein n=1 Tax=unclassified Caballeronia TaxID=2646786 RepID=UPI0020279244|nr:MULTISPECIES: hypothetical protein [unclassified Caballeronia]MDR5794478.1 hypothetical protein [Caballeronia sp. LZ008]
MVGDPGSLASRHCGANREQQSAEEINAEIRRQNHDDPSCRKSTIWRNIPSGDVPVFGLRAVDASAM